MPQPEHLDPGAYAADRPGDGAQAGQTIGVLLIHGYTGSVAETRPMGEYLAAQGLSVRCPLLAGHGTRPEDLTHVRWQTWAAEMESALHDLQHRCTTVFVAGLSLGSLLALWLGARHPEVAGLIAMSPPIKVQNPLLPLVVGLRYVLKYNPLGSLGDDDMGDPQAHQRIWCYDKTPLWGGGELYLLQRRVWKALPTIRQPVLVFQGRHDAQIDRHAAQMVYEAIGSQDKAVVWLEHSGHNVLVDGERESLWAQSYAWMMKHTGGQPEQPAGKRITERAK